MSLNSVISNAVVSQNVLYQESYGGIFLRKSKTNFGGLLQYFSCLHSYDE